MDSKIIRFSLFLSVCIGLLFTSYGEETDSTELEELKRLAEIESKKEKKEEKRDETIFKSGGLGLQKLNPEISVTGDMLGVYHYREDVKNGPEFIFRGLGLHFESYLDPYTKFKAAVPVSPKGVGLGEAYMTRFAVLPGFNITLGKFRQQFGVINRWHKHGLDQIDFPLALRKLFGDGGLNQTGMSFDWSLPFPRNASQELLFQVTNGENSRLFSGNILSIPSLLGHYKFFVDFSKSTYFEMGVTGLVGWNDEWDVVSGDSTIQKEKRLRTEAIGLDMVIRWEPTGHMRYRNIEWRCEIYYLDRIILTPDIGAEDNINPYGGYSYLQAKLSRKLDIGIRFDYYKPDAKGYASTAGGLAPLAYTDDEAYQWQISPYLTWGQSPFVKFRIEYDHLDGKGMGDSENTVIVQAVFAAGPHKHERY